MPVPAKELIERIMNGQRDFSNISVYPSRLNEEKKLYKELNEYLQENNDSLFKNPINFTGAQMPSLEAPDIYLPATNFTRAYLYGSDLRRACLQHSKFNHADLEGVDFGGADLFHSDLSDATLRHASLMGANFKEANLSRVWGLDETSYLKHADFKETKVTEKEKEIIEAALKQRKFLELVK
jgi:uncharacterized protein YjbI with pentapeptide repeats